MLSLFTLFQNIVVRSAQLYIRQEEEIPGFSSITVSWLRSYFQHQDQLRNKEAKFQYQPNEMLSMNKGKLLTVLTHLLASPGNG